MMFATPAQIAAVMGLDPIPCSFDALDNRVSQGLPVSALNACLSQLCSRDEQQCVLYHQVLGYDHDKPQRDTLSSIESARTERLARTFANTAHVWGSPDDARSFLLMPHALLGGKTPLDVSLTELGARRVEMLLGRLFFGITA